MVIFGPVNIAMFDWPWSGIHFTSGLLIGLMLGFVRGTRPPKKFWTIGIGLLVIWELIEFVLRWLDIHDPQAVSALKQSVAGFAFGRETPINSFGDLVIGSVGLLSGRWLTAWRRVKS